jgi:type IV secretion system protein VirB4
MAEGAAQKNVSVVFATQSLADIAQSTIAPAIIESCPQRILLPNDRAIEPQSRASYERFGLNSRQIELISRASPKRHYYLQSSRGNRLFELGLGPVTLALVGSADPEIQRLIDRLLDDPECRDFAAAFLAERGLPWAAPCWRSIRPLETSSPSPIPHYAEGEVSCFLLRLARAIASAPPSPRRHLHADCQPRSPNS